MKLLKLTLKRWGGGGSMDYFIVFPFAHKAIIKKGTQH